MPKSLPCDGPGPVRMPHERVAFSIVAASINEILPAVPQAANALTKQAALVLVR